jgi:hypothetical protein
VHFLPFGVLAFVTCETGSRLPKPSLLLFVRRKGADFNVCAFYSLSFGIRQEAFDLLSVSRKRFEGASQSIKRGQCPLLATQEKLNLKIEAPVLVA